MLMVRMAREIPSSLDIHGDLLMPYQGGIQQLRGQNFSIFDPPPPCVDSFHTLSVDKNRHFLTPSPPHLVHVVIECPLGMASVNPREYQVSQEFLLPF